MASERARDGDDGDAALRAMGTQRARAVTLVARARAGGGGGGGGGGRDYSAARGRARRGGGGGGGEKSAREGAMTPAGYRATLRDEDGEDYASMRHALDALRNIDKVDASGGADARGASNAAREGWASARASAIAGDADRGTYEVVETRRAGGAASSASFSKVGERSLAIGDRAGSILVRRCATDDMACASTSEVGAHDGEIVGMDWSLNGGRLVTVGKVGEVKTWNVTHTSKTTIQMTKQSAFKVHTELTCVLFHAAKDDLVFVGTKMREVLVVDVQVGVLLDKFTMNAVPLCMESNTSGCVLFVGDAEGNISVLTCDARMKKTLSLKSEGDAAVENPLQRVINERSASQSERMSVVGHQQLPDEDGSDPSTGGSKLRSTLASMLSKAKTAVPVPRVAQVKTGYRLRAAKTISAEKSPIRAIRYCPFVTITGRAALLSFHECGIVRMYHANDLPYSSFNSFTHGQIHDWTTPARGSGAVSFAHGHSIDLPLLSASRANRTALYVMPTIPEAPIQALQFTDDVEENSEQAVDIATVSEWSHDSTELVIGYASGKLVVWRKM